MDASRTPSNMLEPRVKVAWRIQTAIAVGLSLIGVIPLSVLMVVAEAPGWVIAILPTLLVVWAVLWLGPVTELRYRRWRWEVTDLEVRLQSGLIIIKRTVIPMARIQHVDTSQGPILRAFSLSEVRVWTAAGAHAIPALADTSASQLRDHIAVLARVTDDGGLDLKRTHPLTVVTKTLKGAWQAIVGLVFMLFAGATGNTGIPIIAFAALLILGVMIGVTASWIAWTRFAYGIVGPDLVVVEGLIVRKRRVIPIARVHGVNMRASLLMRLAGLVEVVVQTAGGGANEPEASIGAIRLAEAEQLRNALLAEKPAAATATSPMAANAQTPAASLSGDVANTISSLAEPAAVGADPVGRISDFRGALGGAETTSSAATFEYKVPLGHLVFGAITSNRVPIMIAVFFGISGQFIEVVGSSFIEETAAAAWSMGALFMGLLLIGVALLASAIAVVSALAKDYGFVARRFPTRIETEAGLLERRQLGIPVTRIQAVRIEESWLRKWLGLATIHVDTAGLERGQQGQQANTGTKAMVPVARKQDLRRLMHGLLPEAEAFPIERPLPGRAVRFYLVVPLLLTSLISIAPVMLAAWLFRPAIPWVMAAAVVVLCVVAGVRVMQWRAAGLGRDEIAITMRSGVIGRKRVRLSRSRIQSLTVRQNPFQKRVGLVTLRAATVSGSAKTAYAVSHMDEAEAWRTVDWFEHKNTIT